MYTSLLITAQAAFEGHEDQEIWFGMEQGENNNLDMDLHLFYFPSSSNFYAKL